MTGNLICLRCKRRHRSHIQSRTDASSTALFPQEAQVLCLVASGETNSDIARALSLSECAVKQHVKSLLYKARARSRPGRSAPLQDPARSQRRS
ncbi:response regulator transcription factor [Microvirga sp. Mcv34]|uniref:response regulator transcription factor n=1 Tax=Microvirga sp. Mcv34 TaxID=2926016 RepID=UPI003966E184